ncbi:hypothetical protein ZIOFF_016574 [Zingiber officinale]|uniref:C2H2-type domain-containing protein n=2 Tax=Zingiber officinale TaxID=94328 RepID=A0A8J5HFQ9_ZINOF|nr:hypothetical protein ZIOFF_016574 [Zingiber officinale]
MEGDNFSVFGNGTQVDSKVFQSFQKSFLQVQSILDQNRLLINEINQNHESKIPDSLSRNVGLIRELNNNIRRVVDLYADLSLSFTKSVEASSEWSSAVRQPSHKRSRPEQRSSIPQWMRRIKIQWPAVEAIGDLEILFPHVLAPFPNLDATSEDARTPELDGEGKPLTLGDGWRNEMIGDGRRMSEKEERDLMTVDSFSQLPFIGGRLPAASKLSSSSSGIRLFGIEVARQPSFDGDVADERAGAKGGGGPDGGADAGESSRTATAAAFRKFECHYCGRQFPTSQALGGHQNAHKRERQHAKRAQLNQYSAAFYGFGHGHRQLYGVMNSYNHQYSAIPSRVSEASFSGSWRLAAPVAQPINGSPLPGRGGVSPAMPLQPLRAEGAVAAGGTNISTAIISSSSSSHQFMIRNLKEKVSLDLHL